MPSTTGSSRPGPAADELKKPELRMPAQLEKQATACLGYPVAAAAGIVALSKALDLLVG